MKPEGDIVVREFRSKTQRSFCCADGSRHVLADSRRVAGLRPSTHRIAYPIVGKSAKGSRFWDVDGNEYVDVAMGFGVLLFGHHPEWIREAMLAYLESYTPQLGPQAALAETVATRVSKLTRAERVAFCNTGTEAVMVALRLARAATRRHHIAMFTGSYHGHFDSVLIGPHKRPICLGVSECSLVDVHVFDYGSDDSLEGIRRLAPRLAAILVEPVQSRNVDLQPKSFLQDIRSIASEFGIALIVDEVLTGFRVAPGGAQELFGVQADIATYGKVIGGGLPIGVVAGRSEFLDGIDGGAWGYDDVSEPHAERIFFAGTFNKNGLGMWIADAVSKHLTMEGPALQRELNAKTNNLADKLNDLFCAKRTPIRVAHFGSLFRFVSNRNIDSFYYSLMAEGVYLWEGRTCFLSTAHSDSDINQILNTVETVTEHLRLGICPG